MDLHRLIYEGSYAELSAAIESGVDVNACESFGRLPLSAAIAACDVAKMKLLIEAGADPELTDDFNTTSLRDAVQNNFAEGVRYLLSLGVEHGYQPKYPPKQRPDGSTMPLPDFLIGVQTEAEWKRSQENLNALLSDPAFLARVQPIIGDVGSLDVLEAFLEAGDELSFASPELKRELLCLTGELPLQITQDEYRAHRFPHFGRANPERIDNPFWQEMIRVGVNTYHPRTQFQDPVNFYAEDEASRNSPIWCYDRFGSSLTRLGDGRYVQIGGEHEDYYDPDFCIYNDVVVHDGQGGVEIYGYPESVFPPTDFHSATLVGEWIYIIGRLGYAEQREFDGLPVFRLHLNSWEIEPVATSGSPPIGLYQHRAWYDASADTIVTAGGKRQGASTEEADIIVPDSERYCLNLATCCWSHAGS